MQGGCCDQPRGHGGAVDLSQDGKECDPGTEEHFCLSCRPAQPDPDAAVREIAERWNRSGQTPSEMADMLGAINDARALGRDDVMNEITKERDQWAGVNAIAYNMLDDLRRTIIARRGKEGTTTAPTDSCAFIRPDGTACRIERDPHGRVVFLPENEHQFVESAAAQSVPGPFGCGR